MSWLIVSLLTKVTRPPTAIDSSFGAGPPEVMVIVAAGGPGEGAGPGSGEGTGCGVGDGDGDAGEPELQAAAWTNAAVITARESRFGRGNRKGAVFPVWRWDVGTCGV